MTSTLKADVLTSKTTNGDLTISGDGSGVPNLEAGFKVGGTAGVPVSALRAGTDGELITWDASGDPAVVAVGTATHILTSNGAGAAPTFQAAGGGGAWAVKSSGTVTNVASIDITSLTKTTKVIGNVIPIGNGTKLRLVTSSNNGSSYDTGATEYDLSGLRSHSTATANVSEHPATHFNMMQDGSGIPSQSYRAGSSLSFEYTIFDPANTAMETLMQSVATGVDFYGTIYQWIHGGRREEIAAVDAIRFEFHSGNLTGSYVAYELN